MRNVILTGGSRGLGLTIATTLADSGYRVLAVARSESAQLRAVYEMNASTRRGELVFRGFDLMQTQEIGGFVAALRQEFGPIYGLVNNAGLGTAGVLAMMRDEEVHKLTQLNVVAPILLSKYVLRSMMVERLGRIINMSSIVSSTGYSGLSAYAASKAALLGFTRSLAREVGQLGITVNAVAPGFIETEMTRNLDETQRQQIKRRSALKRLAEAEDVAAAVAFLIGETGKNITGTVLTVDAGNTA
jgi:3-oxoacyl-[acyl-carrier protein] reductase